MANAGNHQKLKLHDGRVLGYTEYGAPRANPSSISTAFLVPGLTISFSILWHGGQDANVPVSVGHKVAQALPHCNATFDEEEGHLNLARHRITEILGKLVSGGSDH